MGEVYRARDTTLHRDVAIKVLPDLFASDAERLARFTREAQTLAALNHPNIAHIHGLEASGGVRALVMELVEGEDLSQRIARGALPLDEALPIARQIAEALEAAHEQGIIHRDLKPANIKLRADGVVKVLDFGLAKALEPVRRSATGSPNLANSPTITSPAMTMRGMILGTAAYMAPEQAKGKPVDKRADIWAFGCVLYEMLAGRRAFDGDDISTTLAAVLLKEPEWGALPASTPVALRRLLTRCLTKDPKARLRDIGEARVRIDELLGGAPDEAGAPVVTPAVSGWRRVVPWAAAGVLALGSMLIGTVVARRSAGEVTSAAVPVHVHHRAAGEHVVWRSCWRRHRAPRLRSRCHPMAGTSPSSPGLNPRIRSTCARSPAWPPGRFRAPKAERSRSGRRTAGSSGSSRMAS